MLRNQNFLDLSLSSKNEVIPLSIITQVLFFNNIDYLLFFSLIPFIFLLLTSYSISKINSFNKN